MSVLLKYLENLDKLLSLFKRFVSYIAEQAGHRKWLKLTTVVLLSNAMVALTTCYLIFNYVTFDEASEQQAATTPIFCSVRNKDLDTDWSHCYTLSLNGFEEPFTVCPYPYLRVESRLNKDVMIITLNNVFTKELYTSEYNECQLYSTVELDYLEQLVKEQLDTSQYDVQADILYKVSVSIENVAHNEYVLHHNGQAIYYDGSWYDENVTIASIDAALFAERQKYILAEITNYFIEQEVTS